MMKQSMFMPQTFTKLFWDTDLDALDINKNQMFIIERVLNMGNLDELKWLWQTYDEKDVRQVVLNSKKLSKKTARCWQNYFGFREDQMKCFSIYSTNPGMFY